QTYLREIKGAHNVVILDIGIGTGQQIVRLLNDLAKQDCLPKKLTIIGIEPAQESLPKAQEQLESFARQHPSMDFRFEAIPQAVEHLTESDWQTLESSIRHAQGKLIINASFALHHIRP